MQPIWTTHEDLADLYLTMAQTIVPRERKRLRRRLAALQDRCLRERGREVCLEMEARAVAGYHQRWTDLMRRTYDGMMRAAECQLTREPPPVPRMEEAGSD